MATICLSTEAVEFTQEDGTVFTSSQVTFADPNTGVCVTRLMKPLMHKLYKIGNEYPLIRVQKVATEEYTIGKNTVNTISLCIMDGESIEFAAEQQGVTLRKPAVVAPIASPLVEAAVENSAEVLADKLTV